jgi:hypothetical protein
MKLSEKNAKYIVIVTILMVFAYWSYQNKSSQQKDTSINGLIKEREVRLKKYKSITRVSREAPFKNEYEQLQMGNLYSNYFFNVSIDLPDTWNVDKGVSENTLIRAYQADSGLTIALNVFSIVSEDEYYFANKLFNWEKSSLNEFKRQMNFDIKSNYSIVPLELEVYPTKIGTNTFLVTSYKNVEYIEGDTFTRRTLIFTAYKYKYNYTISYSAPEIFYDSTIMISAVNRFTMMNPDIDK